MSGKLEIPADLHALATYPALPATPAALIVGRGQIRGEPVVQLIPPQGGHTLLDLYFCAITHSANWNELADLPDDNSDAALDRVTAFAWRLALSAVRTRPDTGPIPAGVPKEGLK